MNKIIGFFVGKEDRIFDPDIFNVNLNVYAFRYLDYWIKIWGIGDVESLVSDNYFSLSILKSDNLLDRNVVVRLKEKAILIENDWLGSIPVFYNDEEQIVSTISNLCLTSNEIDEEGLGNYFEFGYSVFEKTPFRSVKFLRYFSGIELSQSALKIKYKSDPVLRDDFIHAESSEEAVIELMQQYVSYIESKVKGYIVTPTSGGYDSRILNYLVKDKNRIKSFTYGISKSQSDSYEVVHAKKISEILGTDWNQIQLTEFNNYIDDWFELYGVSTHLHGMYHIEFYKKILATNDLKNASFLSGIFGDIWAGSVMDYKDVISEKDLINLGYTHGISLMKKSIEIDDFLDSKQNYFKSNYSLIANNKTKTIVTIRLKILLISYLTQVPEYFGLPVWTPFLNFEVVRATLNIKEKRRENRVWQRDFFRKIGLNLEDMNLKSSKQNKLDYEIARKSNIEPLNISLLADYVNQNRLIEINNILFNKSSFQYIKNELLFIPKVGSMLRRLGLKNDFLIALNEYYVLKAVEKGLKYVC